MTATVRDIVNGALGLVGQVSGSGVQVYGDDFARECCVRAFDMLFKKRNWEQYLEWTLPVLDGTTGIATQDLYTAIRDFEDFLAVYLDGQSKPLPVLDHRRNWSRLTGTRALTWTSLHVTHPLYATRRLQFYPITAVGTITVLTRKYPLPSPAIQWGWSDIMHLDKSMLEEATAYIILSTDAINADAAAVCKSMMEARYVDIVSSLGSRPMHVHGTMGIPDQWYVTN